jgi:hypothetical protein
MHSSSQEVHGDFSLLLRRYRPDKVSQQRKLDVRIFGWANGSLAGISRDHSSKLLHHFYPIAQSIKTLSKLRTMKKLSEIDILGWSLMVLMTSV